MELAVPVHVAWFWAKPGLELCLNFVNLGHGLETSHINELSTDPPLNLLFILQQFWASAKLVAQTNKQNKKEANRQTDKNIKIKMKTLFLEETNWRKNKKITYYPKLTGAR